MELQNSAGFDNSAGEAHISFGGGWIAARMVVHQDKGVSGVRDHRLKNFSWTGEELIKRSSTEEQ
jgi:hypothetical protein